jgi:hypothetical protein
MIIGYKKYPRLKGGEILFILPGKTTVQDRIKQALNDILKQFKGGNSIGIYKKN